VQALSQLKSILTDETIISLQLTYSDKQAYDSCITDKKQIHTDEKTL